jgi:hypothetical protein
MLFMLFYKVTWKPLNGEQKMCMCVCEGHDIMNDQEPHVYL